VWNSNRNYILGKMNLLRLAQTDEQVEAIQLLTKALKRHGLEGVGGTLTGSQDPQTVVLDVTYQSNDFYISPDGTISVKGRSGSENKFPMQDAKGAVERYLELDKKINSSMTEAEAKGKYFLFCVDLDERGEFRMHVEDENRKEVFSFVYPDSEDDTFFEDGWVKHPHDIEGWQEYLIEDLKVMPNDGELIEDEDTFEELIKGESLEEGLFGGSKKPAGELVMGVDTIMKNYQKGGGFTKTNLPTKKPKVSVNKPFIKDDEATVNLVFSLLAYYKDEKGEIEEPVVHTVTANMTVPKEEAEKHIELNREKLKLTTWSLEDELGKIMKNQQTKEGKQLAFVTFLFGGADNPQALVWKLKDLKESRHSNQRKSNMNESNNEFTLTKFQSEDGYTVKVYTEGTLNDENPATLHLYNDNGVLLKEFKYGIDGKAKSRITEMCKTEGFKLVD